jgi:hypothetical protein
MLARCSTQTSKGDDMIRNRILVALLVAMTLPVASAWAEPSHGGKRPVFTIQEQIIIERNTALRGVVDRDPWLVRRVLDAIAAVDQPSEPGIERRDAVVSRPPPPVPPGNPDLMDRSSPEAAYDLIQLFKKASESGKSQKKR